MAVVEAKWPDIKEAFAGFDAKAVAGLGEPELDDLTQDKRLIRNRRKLEAIVGNARRMVDLEREHNGFGSYLRAHGGFEQTAKDLRKQFKFLRDTGAYFFPYVVNEKVPSHEEWSASRHTKPALSKH